MLETDLILFMIYIFPVAGSASVPRAFQYTSTMANVDIADSSPSSFLLNLELASQYFKVICTATKTKVCFGTQINPKLKGTT